MDHQAPISQLQQSKSEKTEDNFLQLTPKRVAILGASRGLGISLAKKIFSDNQFHLWLSSRKILDLQMEDNFNSSPSRLTLFAMDFTKSTALDETLPSLKVFQPHQIIYCAGGGPYGVFHQKPWHSHLWAFHLNLLFPAQLAHAILNTKDSSFPELKQIIFVGSSVAENNADPGASSYSAAKHGLRGLIQSLVEEYSDGMPQPIDLRLFSPPYMNTQLLPKNAKPRHNNIYLSEPDDIASELLMWADQPVKNASWHRLILP